MVYTMYIRRCDMQTAIQKWGNSHGIRIPKHIIDNLALSENEKVDIGILDDKIVISKIAKPSRKNISELFADYHEEYTAKECDWGSPAGEEIW